MTNIKKWYKSLCGKTSTCARKDRFDPTSNPKDPYESKRKSDKAKSTNAIASSKAEGRRFKREWKQKSHFLRKSGRVQSNQTRKSSTSERRSSSIKAKKRSSFRIFFCPGFSKKKRFSKKRKNFASLWIFQKLKFMNSSTMN